MCYSNLSPPGCPGTLGGALAKCLKSAQKLYTSQRVKQACLLAIQSHKFSLCTIMTF
ncbi:unnamed protein product [Staurois parvus]|uniref:Uncharacterized protein n=1 Tax=Staurois parvus TaxID=386267 RepID=A0ABN9BQR4_9NEOB|nr:unnamed protein product [Staurois parvus]